MRNIVKGLAVLAALKMLMPKRRGVKKRSMWRSRQVSPGSPH